MSGVVTDDEGTPVPGARVSIWLDYDNLPSALTDGSGAYKLNFTGVPGANTGPAGTEDSVAFAQVEAPGYERYARYLLGATEHLVENFHVHRIKRITAGESAQLTMAADDTVCAVDALPGRDSICGIVRVVAPTNGIMTVGAVPIRAGSQLPTLAVYGGNTGRQGNPTSIRVVAGTEYKVDVEVPWGIRESQSFLVQTSMAVR